MNGEREKEIREGEWLHYYVTDSPLIEARREHQTATCSGCAIDDLLAALDAERERADKFEMDGLYLRWLLAGMPPWGCPDCSSTGMRAPEGGLCSTCGGTGETQPPERAQEVSRLIQSVASDRIDHAKAAEVRASSWEEAARDLAEALRPFVTTYVHVGSGPGHIAAITFARDALASFRTHKTKDSG